MSSGGTKRLVDAAGLAGRLFRADWRFLSGVEVAKGSGPFFPEAAVALGVGVGVGCFHDGSCFSSARFSSRNSLKIEHFHAV